MKNNWLDTDLYPFEPHHIICNGHRYHYVDTGTGPVLLFVHGTPSWSFEFRTAIQQLSSSYRCIAVDHIGFGLSDKPEQYAYSLDNHVANLKQLMDELHIASFTLIAHDFGGPIGLRLACSMPERVQHIILANTWCFSAEHEPEFKKLRRVLKSPLLPFLYRQLNFSARFLLPAAFGNKKHLTAALHKHYTAPFSRASERNGTLAFAKSLLHDQQWFAETGEQCAVLRDKRVLLLWGMKDSFITPKYADKLMQMFPHADRIDFPEAGHFVFEEKGEEVSREIWKFLSS